MRQITFSVLACAALTSVASAQNFVPANLALKAANAAIAACQQKGIPATVTFVDAAGHTTLVLRADQGGFIGVEGSYRKAYTVALFGGLQITSGDFKNYTQGLPGLKDFKDTIALAGGLPVVKNKTFIGAIGVSGAPSDAIDEECAKAGLDAIKNDL